MEKPTGEDNHSELLEMALCIHGKLNTKSGAATLDDDLFNRESDAGGVPDSKVIHLNSDGDSTGEESSKTQQVKSDFIIKGYWTADPLEIKPCKTQASTAQAAAAMASIGAYFSPDHVHDHKENQASNSIQLLQLQTALTWVEQLSNTLHAEMCHADRLEIQNTNLKDKLDEIKAENHELKADL